MFASTYADIIMPWMVGDAYGTKEGLFSASILVATNIVSGIYETARHSRNKLSERKKQELGNYNCEEVLRKAEAGDFSFLVRDNKFRSENEQRREGARQLYKTLKPRFRSTLTQEEAYERLIKSGVADNRETAEAVMNKIKDKSYKTEIGVNYYCSFSVTEKANSRGEKGYKLNNPE